MAKLCLESPEDGRFHLEGKHFQPWIEHIGRPDLVGLADGLPNGSDPAHSVRVFAGRLLFNAIRSADEETRLSALDVLWWAVDNESSFRASVCKQVDELDSTMKSDMGKLKLMFVASFNNAVIDTLRKLFEDVPNDLGKALCMREMPKYSLSLEGGRATLRRD